METIIALFMYGYFPRVHKNYSSNYVLTVSSAGHVSAGESSLYSAMRELQEELGITILKDAFELIYVSIQNRTYKGTFNNEYDDVYLVTIIDPIPLEAFTLQESAVSAVKSMSFEEYRRVLAQKDPDYLPLVNDEYGQQLFTIIEKRYKENAEARSLTIEKQLNRYASISLSAEVSILNHVHLSYRFNETLLLWSYGGLSFVFYLTRLTAADKEALTLLVKASAIMDEICRFGIAIHL
ncbi:hypothetical protein K7X08_012758 [Anisodus acutangulus]|uniref:Nudix hydrolase domain-containing protein n=1 Tax=Anisodus acutangulus TaxID=402998 RepID=A0A9Q1RGQ2_9SOLA|nr:hypothetical protein K7X08_012758 [Anisodus acutangulus]